MNTVSLPSHSELVKCVREGVQTGRCPLSPHVYRSWRRCLEQYGMDPASNAPAVVVDSDELHERRARLPQLLTVARAEMTSLYQQMADSGFAILLTDSDGVVLNYVGDPAFSRSAAAMGLQPGALWSEQAQGTNGMGTCLAERAPLAIHHQEHFLVKNTALTCSAAPIFDPEGNLVAVLDASSESHLAQQHTVALVSMAAQTIENRFFIGSFESEYLARFHSRAEFVGTLGEGLLAFDESGRILAANRNALFQFDLRSPAEIVGKPVAEVFNIPFGTLMSLAARRSFYPSALRHARDGKRFYTIIQSPESAPELTGFGLRRRTPGRWHSPNAACAPLERLTFGDPQMLRNIRRAKKVCSLGIPVVLQGETGTGKEVFAHAMHLASNRSDKPFVAVNCTAIPETLIESELFGYRPGAFTGASRQGSPGKIVQASGGTLFLDEIGDMPLALQARLLRVLEQREVVPLGGEAPIKVDIQVISATHCDLRELVRAGRFREDLFYRLHGVSISLPPLRERTDKRQLIERLLRETGSPEEPVSIAADAMALLLAHDWPGNIRELNNVLRATVALREGPEIGVQDLPDEVRLKPRPDAEPPGGQAAQSAAAVRLDPLAEAERNALLEELQRLNWRVSKVARRLSLSRNTVYRKMRLYGIQPPRG